jgi:dGTPase
MDLSDDIGYSVHDFEDAIVNGYIDVRALSSRVNHDDLVDSMVEWIGGELPHDELVAAFDRLDGLTSWIETWEGTRQEMGALKNLTSTLIGRFAGSATAATREHATAKSLVRFGADVVVPADTRAEIAVLKGIVAANVMSHESRRPIYSRQRDLIHELCEVLAGSGTKHLEPGFAADFTVATTEAEAMRAIIDQVASLTDQSALVWHERLAP